MNARAVSSKGGTFEIRIDKADGPVLARVKIGKGSEWAVVKTKLAKVPTGLHNLFVTQRRTSNFDVDWISF